MQPKIITKSSLIPFEAKKFNVKTGEISAVVTSFGNKDVVNDVMMKGSLDKYLSKFNGGLSMLYQHDKQEIIGEWSELSIRGDEVVGKGVIYPEITRAKDAMALISRGRIGSTSIGFQATDYEKNEDNGYNFKEINLVEISLVDRPANPLAQIENAKREDGSVDLKVLVHLLRKAGLSTGQTKAFLAKGQAALRNVVADKQELLNQIKQIGGLK